MPSSIYVPQSATDIRYALLNKSLNEDQFIILNQSSYTWKEYVVEIKILGESHLCTIRNSSNSLQEICACVDISAERESIVRQERLASMPSAISERVHNFSYSFEHTQLDLDTNQSYVSRLQSLHDNPQSASTSYEFPIETSAASQTPPITIVVAELAEQLTFETIHTYPNENTLVYTKSLVTISEDTR